MARIAGEMRPRSAAARQEIAAGSKRGAARQGVLPLDGTLLAC
jgi:hypothetical protein